MLANMKSCQTRMPVNGKPPATTVAVIIAPGPPVTGQSRSLVNENIITNYLESYVNDTAINTTAPSATFNDRIITINTTELFSQSTQRIARELVASLPHSYPVSIDTSWYPNASWTVKKWNGWLNSSVTTYAQTDNDHVTFKFSNCTSTISKSSPLTIPSAWSENNVIVRTGHPVQ